METNDKVITTPAEGETAAPVSDAPVNTAPTTDDNNSSATVPSFRLKEEADKRRALEEELASYKKKESEAAEAKKLEEWKYQELLAEKSTALEQANAQLESLTSFKQWIEDNASKKLEEKMKDIPEDKRSFVDKIIEGKNVVEQLDLVREYARDLKKNTYDVNPSAQGKAEPTTNDYKSALKNGDINSALDNAPKLN